MKWVRRCGEVPFPLQGEGRQPLPQLLSHREGASSSPFPCREGGRGGTTSPPTPLPQGEGSGSPFPRREGGQGVRLTAASLCFVLILMSFTLAAFAQLPARRPLVVIFPEKVEVQKDQPDPNVGIATPLAELLEATRRVDVLIYDSSAPYIQRLVQEGTLKATDATAQPSTEQKRRIVQALDGQFALTVRAAWSEKPPMLPRPPKGKKVDPNLLQNLPTTSVIQVSAVWMPMAGGRAWQTQLESQPVQRALPGGGMTVDPVSTARTAASNLVTRLIAEPMAMLARVDITQKEAQASAPSGNTSSEDTSALMKQLLEEGQKYARAGDLANAIESYRKAADAKPTDPEPRRRLIEAYLQRRMEDAAVAEGMRAVQMVSDSTPLLLVLADAYMSANRLDEAETMYRRMLERDPQNVAAWLHLGDLLWNRARITEAEECYEQAAQKSPTNTEPLMRLAKLHLARAQFARAQDVVGRLYALLPEEDETRRGEVYATLADGVETGITQLAQRVQEAIASYSNGEVTLETLFKTLKGLEAQLGDLQRFTQSLKPIPRVLDAHQRFLLAGSLLQQSLGSLLSFAETKETRYQEEGILLRSECLRELSNASRALRAALVGQR
ncbi:Beta-barrel assembly-enhancing protease [bacterium HR16]|nr:Beta-barrel assembly-enhancing protease [bacterium HR16]